MEQRIELETEAKIKGIMTLICKKESHHISVTTFQR